MGRKLRTPARGVFPKNAEIAPHFMNERERNPQKYRVLDREFAKRAGLPEPTEQPYENLGNAELPVHKKKREIQQAIRDNQISMTEGPTGSGKSTQVGKYALEMGYKKIIYLEPRILIADNLSDRIASELNEELGSREGDSLIGVRHSERSTSMGKPIEVMTPGTYLRVMHELDEYEDEPVLVIGDEIHERNFELELAVAASVEEIRDHPKWRMMLVSATLDSSSIHEAYSEINGRPIPLVSAEGRPHELEMIEEPDITAVEALKHYISKGHKKALLFTAGKQEIRDYSDEIKRARLPNMRVDPLHAKLNRASKRRATHAKLADGQKQAIPSTNAAQSGITIPELTLVISDGLTRRQHIDRDGTESLVTDYCAQDEMIQQAGRAGRDVGGGTVVYVKPPDEYHTYKSMEERAPRSPAEIYSTNISSSVLLTTAIGKNMYNLNKLLLDGVKDSVILEAYDVLFQLGAIDDFNEITPIGEQMARFPVRPQLGRAVVEAMRSGASRELMQHLIATVSAVDRGGLPYFEKGVPENWRHDVGETTTDDYIAQLDMFYATRQFFDGTDVKEAELDVRNYDINNTKNAHRTFDKICRELKLNTRDISLDPPSEEMVKKIHDYLLSGLFDFAHRKVESSGEANEYVSTWSSDDPTRRALSSRGTYKSDDRLVVGMPRGFEKKHKGDIETHYVIENVMPTSARKLAKYVTDLAMRVPREPTMEGGRLVYNDDLWFGDIFIDTVPSKMNHPHTPESKQQVMEAAFDKPTQTVAELIKIKRELEYLMRLTPKDKIAEYFPDGILTDEWLQAQIEAAISDGVESIIDMDNNLRSMVSRKRLSLESWITPEAYVDIIKNSPELVELPGDATYSLHYTHGMPVVNGFNLRDADKLPNGAWVLPDGREIFINYRINSKDTKRHSANDIKAYARSLD